MSIIMMIIVAVTIIVPATLKLLRINGKLPYFFSRWNKLNNKYHIFRIISSILSLICIVLFFVYRWVPVLNGVIEQDLINQDPSQFRSANLSIIMGLDLCSLLSLVMLLLVIFDWKKKIILKSLAPLSILGGSITIFFTCSWLFANDWSFKALFIGVSDVGLTEGLGALMFLLHYWMFTIGFLTLLTSNKKYEWKNLFIMLGYIALYLAYIIPVSRTLDIRSHVTATVIGDFIELDPSYYIYNQGVIDPKLTYGMFAQVFPFKDWWLIAIFAWISFVIFIAIIIFINNFFYWIPSKLLSPAKRNVKKSFKI